MSVCKTCHLAITWTTNVTTGKRMPVDPTPTEAGNIILLAGNDGPESRVLTKAELAARPTRSGLYVSHFATCPQAAAHRR